MKFISERAETESVADSDEPIDQDKVIQKK